VSLKLILVVGGNGFIGQHFRDLAKGHREVAYVRRGAELDEARPGLGETLIDAAMFEGPAGDDLIRRARAVIYLRSASVPGTFEAHPDEELTTNAQPALSFFARCAKLNIGARIIFTSSGGAVYGARQNAPISENQPTMPISSYGYGKVIIEESLRFLHRSQGLRFSILRLSNPVGRHHVNPKQGLVSAAFHAVRTGVPLPLFGTTNIRDYVDADDVAAALMMAACDGSKENRVLNIGSGLGLSIAEVISMIEATLSISVPVEIKAPRKVDVPHVILDCERAERELGWRATTPISETLVKTWRGTETR
jgi:UDP-glucose 4-epimerase